MSHSGLGREPLLNENMLVLLRLAHMTEGDGVGQRSSVQDRAPSPSPIPVPASSKHPLFWADGHPQPPCSSFPALLQRKVQAQPQVGASQESTFNPPVNPFADEGASSSVSFAVCTGCACFLLSCTRRDRGTWKCPEGR